MKRPLPTFHWQALDARGQAQRGELQAESRLQARALLRRQGLQPLRLRKAYRLLGSQRRQLREAPALLARQLASLLKAGVPLLQALDLLATGSTTALRQILQDIRRHVAEGHSLHEALRRHPAQFDRLYCSLVAVGEQSGTLDRLLERIAHERDKGQQLQRRIRKALRYPLLVVLIALLVCVILLVEVVPQFEAMFAGFGAELPTATRLVITLSEQVRQSGPLLLLGCAVLLSGYRQLLGRRPALRQWQDQWLLRLPLLGRLQQQGMMAHFARTLATTLAAGVPLLEALESCAESAGNTVFRLAIRAVRQEVAAGQPLHMALRAAKVFPPLAIQMIAVGEEAGALDSLLERIADYYEMEVDNMVNTLTSLMEPMIMAVLGLLVGGLVLAMYLPLFQLGATV